MTASQVERRIVGSILLTGRMPQIPLTPESFRTKALGALFRDMQVVAGEGKPIGLVSLWLHDKTRDPIWLADLEAEVACDNRIRAEQLDEFAVELFMMPSA